MSLGDVWDHQVRQRPDALFLRFLEVPKGSASSAGGQSEQVTDLTYAQFDARIRQTANLFIDHGVGQGDRVAVHACNSVEFVECLLALALIGGVCVPLNATYLAEECSFVIAKCQPRLVVSDPELAGLPGMEKIPVKTLLTGQAGPDGYRALQAAQPTVLKRRRLVKSSDLLEIMFTSGTTSEPKGVMLTHANFIFSGEYVNWQLAMRQDDRYLTTMAVTHANFQLSALTPVISSGSSLVLASRYSATRFWRQVRQNEASLVQSMSMIARTCLAQPVDPAERDHRVRYVHYFLPLTLEEKEAYESRFGIKLINNYGSTETVVGSLTDSPFGPSAWPSVGRPGLGYQAWVVDGQGQDCPQGQVGEIVIGGQPGVSLLAGYWQDPAATKQVLDAEGAYHTGDYGWVDETGDFFYAGRNVDLIKRSGENVSALEVEGVLMGCPGVIEAVVYGVPDSVRDEVVAASLVRQPGSKLTEDEVMAYAASRLACFKVPSFVEFRTRLPRSFYGKVLKEELREQARQKIAAAGQGSHRGTVGPDESGERCQQDKQGCRQSREASPAQKGNNDVTNQD